TGQAKAEALSRRVPVLHGQSHVGDPRALVSGYHDDAPAPSITDEGEHDLSPPCVLHDVACDLGDRRGHDGEVTPGKANVRGQLTSSLSGGQDVVLGVDLK